MYVSWCKLNRANGSIFRYHVNHDNQHNTEEEGCDDSTPSYTESGRDSTFACKQQRKLAAEILWAATPGRLTVEQKNVVAGLM